MKAPDTLVERLQRIRMIVTDVDGVLTDGKMIVDADGRYIKNFNAHDGYGVFLARHAGIRMAIITAREAPATRARAADLGFDEVYMNDTAKLTSFDALAEKYGMTRDEIAYIGDDWLDIPVIRAAGAGFAVANGRPEVRDAADHVTDARGGEGAVREVIEMILDAQGKLPRP